MSVVHTILTVVQVICSILLVLVVTVQSGKTAGLNSAIGGGTDTFLSKNSPDAKLTRATKWIAGVFILLTLVLCLPFWA